MNKNELVAKMAEKAGLRRQKLRRHLRLSQRQ